MLIPSGVIATVSALATFVMWKKKQNEHAFTRLCVTLFYLFLTIAPETPIEYARIFNRWFWVLVFGVEIVWWFATVIIRRWRKQ